MNDWLEKDDVPEVTKATMYAQQLQRVNQLKNQVFRPEPSPVQMITHTEQTMTSESDSATPSQQLNATDKQIIDSVPKTMQNRAKLLIQKLKDHSDVISWNDNGQLVLEGSIVPNSNIVDLVNDVMQERKGFNPEHSNTFAKALAKINVPEKYLRTPIESIPCVGTIDDKILKHLAHHLFQRQLKSPLKYHEKHPKAQRLLLLFMESGLKHLDNRTFTTAKYMCIVNYLVYLLYNLGALAKFM